MLFYPQRLEHEDFYCSVNNKSTLHHSDTISIFQFLEKKHIWKCDRIKKMYLQKGIVDCSLIRAGLSFFC